MRREFFQVAKFEFEKSQDAFINASKMGKAYVLLGDDDLYVNDAKTEKFLKEKCQGIKYQMCKSIHEIPMMRPQFCISYFNQCVKECEEKK